LAPVEEEQEEEQLQQQQQEISFINTSRETP